MLVLMVPGSRFSSGDCSSRDGISFDIVNCPFIGDGVPHVPFCGVFFLGLFSLRECLVILLASMLAAGF